ncbi:hypothetical protein T01_12838 [Trichinella spiralis]|uniref:Uncharacterized protein n=1 Tax=Trichinella spiralis TaxID=6334 RepID=A0A0V1BS06_TRISP|nr:hypothetical protein T01_12838 [Trichinella spiralis]
MFLRDYVSNDTIAICIIGTICSPPGYPLVRTVTLIPWLSKSQPYCKFHIDKIKASIHSAQLVWNKWPLNLEYCFSYYMGLLPTFFWISRKLKNIMEYRLYCFSENEQQRLLPHRVLTRIDFHNSPNRLNQRRTKLHCSEISRKLFPEYHDRISTERTCSWFDGTAFHITRHSALRHPQPQYIPLIVAFQSYSDFYGRYSRGGEWVTELGAGMDVRRGEAGEEIFKSDMQSERIKLVIATAIHTCDSEIYV